MGSTRRSFVGHLVGAAGAVALTTSAPADAPKAAQPSLAADPLRPQYHLLPAKNWINDPNGPLYWKGKYHMFFQHNPNEVSSENMHWGHAVSSDMVHWKHLPIALAPTKGGPDQDGVWSGSAFVQNGKVGMMYTGIKSWVNVDTTAKPMAWRQSQYVAFANDDDLTNFTKEPRAAILGAPVNIPATGFRDPCPWKQGDWWYTLIGSGVANMGGALLLFRSKDIRSWEFVKIFAQRKPSFEGYSPWEVWECPDFFPLGDRHVLLFSTMGKSFWQTGRFHTETLEFHPEQMGILDYGSFYAPKSQLDASGNRILWGWIQEARPAEKYRAAGWAGMLSLPRVLTIAPDGGLRYEVAECLSTLRRDEQHVTGVTGKTIRIADGCGEAIFRTRTNPTTFALKIEGARDKRPMLTVTFDGASPHTIAIDQKPIALLPVGEPLELHLHLDGSVIELIVNQRIAWTKRFYYEGSAQDTVLRWEGEGSLDTVTSWRIEPISSDRLTT